MCFCIRKTFQYTLAIYGVHFWYSRVIINFTSFHFKIYHHLQRKKKRNHNRLSCIRKMVPEFVSNLTGSLNTSLKKKKRQMWLQTILHFLNYLTVYSCIWPRSSTRSYQKGWLNICKLPYVWQVIKFIPPNKRKQVGWSTNFNQPRFASQTYL